MASIIQPAHLRTIMVRKWLEKRLIALKVTLHMNGN
jgi:hypothetical protein